MSSAQGDSILFHRIVAFFAIYMCITSVVNLANSGSIGPEQIALAMGSGAPGEVNTPFAAIGGEGGGYTEGANIAAGNNLTGIDFTTETMLNPNITYTKGIGTWTLVNGKGLVLTSSPLNLVNGIYLSNVMSVGNTYTLNAKINNNEAGGDFTVYPRYAYGTAREDVKLVFASDGVHLKKADITYGLIDPGDEYFYPMPNARDTLSGGSTITTILTETPTGDVFGKTSPLTVIKDGTTLFNIMVSSPYSLPYSNLILRHGGVESSTQNFIVMGFPNTELKDTSVELYSGSDVAEQMNATGSIGQFLALLGTALGFTGSSLIPIWFNTIVIGSCTITLSYLYLKMIRGN